LSSRDPKTLKPYKSVTRHTHIAEKKKETYKSIFRDVNKLIISANYLWHITIVGRGNNILKLLASKDVNRHKMTLRMAMLSGLGGRHLHNLPNKTVCQMKRKRGNEGHPAA
jgi:hypothetical protein